MAQEILHAHAIMPRSGALLRDLLNHLWVGKDRPPSIKGDKQLQRALSDKAAEVNEQRGWELRGQIGASFARELGADAELAADAGDSLWYMAHLWDWSWSAFESLHPGLRRAVLLRQPVLHAIASRAFIELLTRASAVCAQNRVPDESLRLVEQLCDREVHSTPIHALAAHTNLPATPDFIAEADPDRSAGIHQNAERWLHGSRPRRASIQFLSRLYAAKRPEQTERFRRALTVAYSYRPLAEKLLHEVGSWTSEFTESFWALLRTGTQALRAGSPDSLRSLGRRGLGWDGYHVKLFCRDDPAAKHAGHVLFALSSTKRDPAFLRALENCRNTYDELLEPFQP